MPTSNQLAQGTDKLSKTTISLHWVVAIIMIFLLASGVYMTYFEDFSWYSWHKSIGVLALLIAMARVIWRIKEGFPKPLDNKQAVMNKLAKVAHFALIICTIIMPVSGVISSAAGGYGVPFFGLSLFDSVAPAERPINGLLAGFAHEAHYIAGYFMIAILALHILGALWHQLIKKDNTLYRMVRAK
ncbi:cytochrome b [Spartinivicinus poritis]|uniref:Cytochrome b n=1 Tax=Spartinivicinus poritis TaxID=2994640 RepID=A0ABT5UII5_9GAMM|nr:cytochrome b [Spartinivicinus sp. A2-2]MDE1464864.1 cytochrome b [Spartinivicinus sp. A2-2]